MNADAPRGSKNVSRIRSLDELRASSARAALHPSYYLETHFKLSEVLAARHLVGIDESGERLIEIPPNSFSFVSPHPYVAVGAPYGSANPFFVRENVMHRLVAAQSALEKEKPGHRLHVFDGYRPQAVQTYMRDFDFRRLSKEQGVDSKCMTLQQISSLWDKVDSLWARPSNDPQLPPPHSTGAAMDVTIIDSDGALLPMGSEFDEVSERILPHYYRDHAESDARQFNENRELLRRIMEGAGFRRLTHEWWHFSYGDQMWALLESVESGETVGALYGEFSRL